MSTFHPATMKRRFDVPIMTTGMVVLTSKCGLGHVHRLSLQRSLRVLAGPFRRAIVPRTLLLDPLGRRLLPKRVAKIDKPTRRL